MLRAFWGLSREFVQGCEKKVRELEDHNVQSWRATHCGEPSLKLQRLVVLFLHGLQEGIRAMKTLKLGREPHAELPLQRLYALHANDVPGRSL